MNKEEFINILTVLQKQHDKDVAHHKALCDLYGAEDIPLYDNTILANQLIKQLQAEFPAEENHECEIILFIYTLNFGRHKSATITSAEDLWVHLIKQNRPNYPIDWSLLETCDNIFATKLDDPDSFESKKDIDDWPQPPRNFKIQDIVDVVVKLSLEELKKDGKTN